MAVSDHEITLLARDKGKSGMRFQPTTLELMSRCITGMPITYLPLSTTAGLDTEVSADAGGGFPLLEQDQFQKRKGFSHGLRLKPAVMGA